MKALLLQVSLWWGRCTSSERALISLWLLVGLSFAAVAVQWRAVHVTERLAGRLAQQIESPATQVRDPRIAQRNASDFRPGVAAGSAEAILTSLQAQLPTAAYAEDSVQSLFAAARREGVLLAEGRYRLGTEPSGLFQIYEIDLPVRGSYAAIRRFVERSLLALPHAALVDARFKRESARANEVQAQLRFVLYLDVSARASDTVQGRTP
jgi:hypothetical protein